MKRAVLVLFMAAFVFSTTPIYAEYTSGAYGGTKGETVFTRLGDWFATVGKTEDEKFQIKNRRRAARKIKRANKMIKKRKKEFSQQK